MLEAGQRLRIFAIMQITASFLLLTGAAVLMRTLYVLETTPPPFDPARVLAVNLPVMSYGRTPEQVQEFYRDVQRRVSALPGVSHVSTGFSVPWRDAQGLDISLTFAAQGAKTQERTRRLAGASSGRSPLGISQRWACRF